MPTYQYACPDCGLEFEKVQKFIEDPIRKCPKCGKRHVYRVVSKVAVTFKGSGWYITDSKKGHTLSDAKDSKDTKDAKDSKPDKTETKADDKAETKEAPAAEPAKEAPATESKPEKKSKKKTE
jgi:putative FmdB family regulatory protein